MFCVSCGLSLPDDALYCMKCGKPQKKNESQPECVFCELTERYSDSSINGSILRSNNEKLICDLHAKTLQIIEKYLPAAKMKFYFRPPTQKYGMWSCGWDLPDEYAVIFSDFVKIKLISDGWNMIPTSLGLSSYKPAVVKYNFFNLS